MRRLLVGAGLAALVVAGGACAAPDPGRAGVSLFYQGRYAEAASVFHEAAETGSPQNAALDRCRAASAEMALGELDAALQDLLSAYTTVEDLSASGGEQTAAVLGQEARKTWKGEPHERALVSFYAGLGYYRRGDWGNALAGFKNAVLHDSDAAEDGYRSDVALYFMMQGRVHLIWGQDADARRAFAEAVRLAPGNPHVTYERNRDANVVLVADVGAGPERFATGRHGQLARFRPRSHPDVGARVSLDGADAGTMAVGVDVLREATTRGGRKMEGILAGKAVFKDAATIAGVGVLAGARKDEQVALGVGLILLGQAISAQADTRHWETLPADVLVWTGRLEPGPEHVLRVEFLGRDGRPVPGFRAYEARLRLHPGSQILLYARSGPSSSSDPGPAEMEEPAR